MWGAKDGECLQYKNDCNSRRGHGAMYVHVKITFSSYKYTVYPEISRYVFFSYVLALSQILPF